MPLATAEESSWFKEQFKIQLSSTTGSAGDNYKDKFFQLNYMTGDKLTNMDKKDYITNQDAYILHYHPKFKSMPLDERIHHYYHIENLKEKREFLY